MINLARLRRPLALLALALPVAIAACSLKSDTAAPPTYPYVKVESTTFSPSLGVDLANSTKTTRGVYVRDITVGSGVVVEPGTRVSVKYAGFFPTGQSFDSSLTNGPPLDPFVVGAGRVIAGWDEGLIGMRVGGRRQLVIPSELAYGPGGSGDRIPPNAVLVFRVDLLGAQ